MTWAALTMEVGLVQRKSRDCQSLDVGNRTWENPLGGSVSDWSMETKPMGPERNHLHRWGHPAMSTGYCLAWLSAKWYIKVD
ncbi:MAG: hypothetical protein Ct9H90mP16_11950 [Candidatus Poseidoniales archaeon]|nr:MAG: hypothetical protein Ct9H90mP16_11950 [Candidatus Poseidoniales archaeon]